MNEKDAILGAIKNIKISMCSIYNIYIYIYTYIIYIYK